jgi:hypothetical protein
MIMLLIIMLMIVMQMIVMQMIIMPMRAGDWSWAGLGRLSRS